MILKGAQDRHREHAVQDESVEERAAEGLAAADDEQQDDEGRAEGGRRRQGAVRQALHALDERVQVSEVRIKEQSIIYYFLK